MWSLPILPITPERHGEPRLLYQSHGEIDTLRAIAIVGDELHVKGSDGGGDMILRLDKRTGGALVARRCTVSLQRSLD